MELHTRVKEHQRKIKKPPKNEPEYQALIRESALANHVLDTAHNIDFDRVEVISKNLKSTPQRLIREALEITKSVNSLNKVEGIQPSGVWRAILSHSV